MKLFPVAMKGRVIDITTGISASTSVYDGDPLPDIEKISSIDRDGYAVSRILIGSHTGTHVDAPSHIFEEGRTVDELLPESFMGKAVLLDMSETKGNITADALQRSFVPFINEENVDVLLIKTEKKDSLGTVLESDRILSTNAGKWIIKQGFHVIGVDILSVDSESSLPNHHLFLSNGINIVEYLHLSEVVEGVYYFICLPLKIIGCDGAPARAILLDQSSIV